MKPLLWAFAFGIAGLAGAALAVRDSAGEGWEVLPYAAGLATFSLAALARGLTFRSQALPRARRGAAVGALVAFLSHPLAWFLLDLHQALLGGPPSSGEAPLGVADAASGSIVLAFWSLLLTGWWTVPLGAALGALLARLERRASPPREGEATVPRGQEAPSVPPREEAPSASAPADASPGADPMVVTVVAFVLGLLLLTGTFVYPPLYDLPAGLDWRTVTVVFLVLLAVQGSLLRKRESPWPMLALSCFFLAPVALALAVGGTLTLNGLLDGAEPTHHTASVLKEREVRRSTGSDSPFELIQVKSWNAGQPDPWIEVHPRLYEEVTPGESEVGVVTKPGWLGIEWVIEAHLEVPEEEPATH